MVKQVTSSAGCLRCKDPCCHFHLFNGECSPTLTKEEVDKIVEKGFKKSMFRKGSKGTWKIKLKRGKDYLYCPFFSNNRCIVYDVEPFDCGLWPFNIMRSQDRKMVLLAMDDAEECPAVEKVNEKILKNYVKYLKRRIQSKKMYDFFKKNPGLIYPYDEELMIVCELEKLQRIFR